MTPHIILGLLIGIAISALWPSLDRLCRRLKPPRGRHMNAAEIIGVAPATIRAYIKTGHLAAVNGYVSLIDALTFDYQKAKSEYLKDKHHG